MRTMASVWFFVIVLVSVQKVFGNVCTKDENKFSCDECIRCGGEWCNNVGATHCSFMQTDEFCPNNREYTVMVKEDPEKPGKDVNPVYAERNLVLKNHGPDKIDIRYSAKSTQKTPKLAIVETTQTFNIDLKQSDPVCSGSSCVFTIEATPTSSFCNATGGLTESLEVKVNVGLEEEVRIKYFVACACGCSQKVERNLKVCNGKGNFSCGVCTCDPEWEGDKCDKEIKINCGERRRGDINQCSLYPKNPADCSFNGECGPCETCVCFTDREGSQYFEQENSCAGLCNVIASECGDCLFNTSLGHCSDCIHPLTMERYNVSLTNETDGQNRKIWVKCNETIDDCGQLQFFAKRDRTGISVMMVNHCKEIIAGANRVADTKVPIILGVLAVLAVVAAVGGVMLWKHMNTVPPVPLNDPQYQNIDAEDCTGENPLYKPPTSSFKNPTYGKW